MSDHGPTKSPEKTTQRSAAREPRPASLHQSELHPVLKLQRVIGNRQVAHLIQRGGSPQRAGSLLRSEG